MKRLFVFCDGTWQDGTNNNGPLTNVATLARSLQTTDSDDTLQIVYYDGGVGNVTSRVAQFIDGATGRGISAKIRNAYSFISHNYEKQDEIILVGFSRGAFAVQCLASLISQTGLLRKNHLYYLRGLFTLWAYQEVRGGMTKLHKEVRGLEDSGLLQKVRITACAVWDTVSTLGFPTQLPPRPLSFVGKRVPKCVDYAFQALALDETRLKFKPCVWDCKEEGGDNTVVSQCWFLGSHGDVGGTEDAALGVVTLLWMIGKLHKFVGVRFDEAEIMKHLKHRYLEWDFVVNKAFASFKETRVLSVMPHSGKISKPAWYWLLLGCGWKSRTDYLISTTSNQPLRESMRIHFTVRLRMSSSRNKSSTLANWNTVRTSSRVRWQSKDGRHSRYEHALLRETADDMEHSLLSNWSNGVPQEIQSGRGVFVQLQEVVQDPRSKTGLGTFAAFLLEHMLFEEDMLAPNDMYSP